MESKLKLNGINTMVIVFRSQLWPECCVNYAVVLLSHIGEGDGVQAEAERHQHNGHSIQKSTVA